MRFSKIISKHTFKFYENILYTQNNIIKQFKCGIKKC